MGPRSRTTSSSARATVGRPRAGREGSVADLAELRGTTYGLLGSLFLYPARGDLSQLVAAAGSFPGWSSLASDFPFFPRLRVLLERLQGMSDEALEHLEHEYVDLFVVSASQAPCPPYESAYVEQKGRERGLTSIEVERAYAASGVSVAEQGELPDHAALELGFLSMVCSEEERAWRDAEVERALDCLLRETRFHDEHLQRWLPTFARRLGSVARPGSFYRTLADATHAFVIHDRDLVSVLARERSLVSTQLRAASL